jgi:hypothetical protein
MITIHVSNISANSFPAELEKTCQMFPEVWNGRPFSPKEIIMGASSVLMDGHMRPIVTMSEHLILFVLYCIRRTTNNEVTPLHLSPADVQIVYHGSIGTEPQILRVDALGEFIDRWPNRFFDERSELLFG